MVKSRPSSDAKSHEKPMSRSRRLASLITSGVDIVRVLISTPNIQNMKNKIILLTLVAALSGLPEAIAAEPPTFKSADKNGDGKLSAGEFASADAGRKGDENTQQMFTKIDSDGDKFISPIEFAPYRVRRGDTTKKPEKKKKKDKDDK